MKHLQTLAIITISASAIFAFTVFASAEEGLIPSWIKNTAGFWVNDQVSDTEFINALEFLISNEIIQVPKDSAIKELEAENAQLKTEIESLRFELDSQSPVDAPTHECSGTAQCFSGIVTKVTDGDTVQVDGITIRFALSSAPEMDEPGGEFARDSVEDVCPVGSSALVDEDDYQTEGSFGRIVAVVYCNGINLNEFILEEGLGDISTNFCLSSEFALHPWAKKFGC